MKLAHDGRRRRPGRVAAPVQVCLSVADRERLERLAARMDATKSEVLRQGLAALDAIIRQAESPSVAAEALPTLRGAGLLPGVDLGDTAAFLDLMEGSDAAR